MTLAADDPPAARRLRPGIAAPLVIGGAVSVALGVYANVHEPTRRGVVTFGFTSTVAMKNWLATAVVVLVVAQLATALRLYGRIGTRQSAPSWLGDVHRLVGTVAFAVSLPVAFHCLWSLGYDTGTTRVAVHSLLGCAAYGAFAAKFVAARSEHQPAWALPVLGSVLAVVLVATWWSSALWFFTNVSWDV